MMRAGRRCGEPALGGGLVFQQFSIDSRLNVEDNLAFQAGSPAQRFQPGTPSWGERSAWRLLETSPEQLSSSATSSVSIGRASCDQATLLLARCADRQSRRSTRTRAALARDLSANRFCGFLMVTHTRACATLDRQVTPPAGLTA